MKYWRIIASPHFVDVYCPKHHNKMQELENGWFGNPVWWCKECKYPYELKLTKMRNFNQEAVDKQLNAPTKTDN